MSKPIRRRRMISDVLNDANAHMQVEALEKSVAAAAHDNAVYVEALRDLISFFDKVSGHTGSGGNWTVAEVKRIEEIRLLSLGV
jgi:hypothetical protein